MGVDAGSEGLCEGVMRDELGLRSRTRREGNGMRLIMMHQVEDERVKAQAKEKGSGLGLEVGRIEILSNIPPTFPPSTRSLTSSFSARLFSA